MNFAAVGRHRSGRATPALCDAPQRRPMGATARASTYRKRNAVQTNRATSRGLHLRASLPSRGTHLFIYLASDQNELDHLMLDLPACFGANRIQIDG